MKTFFSLSGSLGLALGVLLFTLFLSTQAFAATTCTFTTSGTTMTLAADCTTDETILIPDGFTLNGNGSTITAIDPTAGHFLGAIVANDGAVAHITGLTVTANGLADVCDGGNDRLRGILFDGASGTIIKNEVVGINQGASGCQEGNAIEVRNAPFDGTHPNTVQVEIAHNDVTLYQKTGILANGDVSVNVHHNIVGASATQANLAANSLQLGFGAAGIVKHNQIDGNEWLGDSDFAATAILVFDADIVNVSQNNIRGNSEVGIYIEADGGTYINNRITDEGADQSSHVGGTITYDIGIGDYGTGNTVSNNKVKGFVTPYDGVIGGKNKSIPGPNKGEAYN